MTRLEIADLEQIVSTLHREHERLTGSRKRSKGGAFKRAAFLALRVVAYSIPITLALFLLGYFLLDWGGSIQLLLLGLWLVVALLLLLPLTLINLPLIITAWRERRPIVSRNLLVPAFPSWQLRARWVVAGLTVVAAILAVLLPDFGWAGFTVFLLVVVFPFLVLMLQSFLGLARRSLALARSVDELLVVLDEKLATARRESQQVIELPHELAVKLSDATDGMLASERLRAIDESVLVLPSQYSVAQSGSFRESLQTARADGSPPDLGSPAGAGEQPAASGSPARRNRQPMDVGVERSRSGGGLRDRRRRRQGPGAGRAAADRRRRRC